MPHSFGGGVRDEWITVTEQLTADATRQADEPVRPKRRRRAVSVLRHEWTLAAVASLALAVLMTWPAMRDPRRTLPFDFLDPALQAWQMSWAGHAIRTDPTNIWHANTFHGERYSYAFSDTLFGYLPAGLIGSGMEAALLRYNTMFVLVFALAAFGAYVLARQLGAHPLAAAVAGAAFGYAPWRWTQAAHLHVISTGGIALSLAMLARGHGYSLRHGYRPELARPRWALAGWLTAAWQVSIGFGIGLPFGYALGLLTLVAAGWWLARRPPFPRRLLRADLIGCVAFVTVSAAMAYPFLRVVQLHPYGRRSLEEVMVYSPSLKGFFTASSFSTVWQDSFQDVRESLAVEGGGWEALLLPGYTLYALALLGVFVSAWSWRRRLLLTAAALGSLSLAMGLRAPVATPYYLLYHWLPGWDGIRTPGRLVVWTTLVMGLLAAGAGTALIDRFGRRSGPGPASVRPAVASALLVPLAFVLAEGVQRMPFPVVPRAPGAFATAQGPVLVLPTNWRDDEVAMLWSTEAFVPLVNGSSGFVPARLAATRTAVERFPDAASVAYLRGMGVRTVVVPRASPILAMPHVPSDVAFPARALAARLTGLTGITREDTDDAVVYHLEPLGRPG